METPYGGLWYAAHDIHLSCHYQCYSLLLEFKPPECASNNC